MAVGLLLPGTGVVGFTVDAFLMEHFMHKKTDIALREGLGSFIGFLVRGLARFVIGVTMIGIFIREVLS